MHDGLSVPDPGGLATARLMSPTWATYLQRACLSLKAAGEAHRNDGMRALVARLKRTRPSTYEHCLRVARVARQTGRAFGFDAARLQQLSAAAMIHDIGKSLVPESILGQPRRPTRFERYVLHLHPTLGTLLTSYFNLPAELRVRAEHHHERWDGRGYPHGLGGTDIPLMSRIVNVADAYDAMITRRPYNRPRTESDAVAELRAEAGRQFDPHVVEAFLDARVAHA